MTVLKFSKIPFLVIDPDANTEPDPTDRQGRAMTKQEWIAWSQGKK